MSAHSELIEYVLIPIIFILRSHTAEFWQFLLVMLQLLILVNCLNKFTSIFKRACSHMISLRQFTGNFPGKSVCVKGSISGLSKLGPGGPVFCRV